MAFSHGKNTKVAFGGRNLTTYFNEASASATAETAQTSTFTTSAHTYVVGLKDGTVSLSGLFDGSTDAVDQALQEALGVEDQYVLVLPGGDGTGSRALFAKCEGTSYEISSPIGDVVSVSAEFQGDGGVHSGAYLRSAQSGSSFDTITAGGVAVTENSASADGGASSASGGVGQAHVMANGLNVAATIKIQHSVDNATWVDLITFSSVTAGQETAEQMSVTGTVNRYVRSVVSVPIGTGSAQVAVAFKRN